jgi:hypothetical protein
VIGDGNARLLQTSPVLTAGAGRADTEDEVKAIFAKFVAAQNAHDLRAVGEILQDSPQMFWITRGQVYLGREAALKRFDEYYQGTCRALRNYWLPPYSGLLLPANPLNQAYFSSIRFM